jgi:hypothetical protein
MIQVRVAQQDGADARGGVAAGPASLAAGASILEEAAPSSTCRPFTVSRCFDSRHRPRGAEELDRAGVLTLRAGVPVARRFGTRRPVCASGVSTGISL